MQLLESIIERLRLSRRRARLLFCISVLTFSLPGCTLTWVSRRPDLRTFWGDINSYNRLSFGFERRHLDAASLQIVNEYRWLHGPVPGLRSLPMAKYDNYENWQKNDSMPSVELPMMTDPTAGKSASRGTTDREKERMPLVPAPASKNSGSESESVPVEIDLPPLDSLREPSGTSGEEARWRPRKTNRDASPASYRYGSSSKEEIRSVGHHSGVGAGALPGATILFARP